MCAIFSHLCLSLLVVLWLASEADSAQKIDVEDLEDDLPEATRALEMAVQEVLAENQFFVCFLPVKEASQRLSLVGAGC